MNRKIALGLVAFSMVAGAGFGFWMNQANDQPAQADEGNGAKPTASSPTPKPAPSNDDLIVSPGRVGAIVVGMPVADALATGLVVRDAEREDVCGGQLYRWKDDTAHSSMDVATDQQDRIATVGVSRGGYPTDKGVRVGDRLSTLQEVYGSDLSAPAEAGYGQSGVFVHDGDRWLGFLFDETVGEINETSRVTFMEVTEGEAPGLMRDGC